MSDQEKALIPIRQETVFFYEDEITAVVVDEHSHREVYVPLRPICELIGVDWSAQSRRVRRDPVLDEVSQSVAVTTTDIPTDSRRPRTSEMICLPLDFLNGWMFGINANRVNEDVRDRLIQYQRECYRVLANHFRRRSPERASSALAQVEQMGLAIARMAREQIEFDERLEDTEKTVGEHEQRIVALEQQIAPGEPVTEAQASQISQAVKTVAVALGERTGRNEFGACYGELYRKFSVTSYKLIPASRFQEVMDWLTEWHQSIVDEQPF
jgi:hypothetical protein